MLRVLVAVLVALLPGCAAAVGPAYSPQDLQQRCQRDGGWWRPDVGTGYCERV